MVVRKQKSKFVSIASPLVVIVFSTIANALIPELGLGESGRLRRTQQTNQKLIKQLEIPHDLHKSASSNSDSFADLVKEHRLPSIYHSIIDQSDAPRYHNGAALGQASGLQDLVTAAGHHRGHAYGKYYEYREVPKKKTWKFGYKRGNHKHTIARHEHGKAGKHPHFKTKVRWHDKKSKGKGIHLWDYNHHDKKHYHHG